MKLPKKVIISGKEFKVKLKKNSYSGHFSTIPAVMIIGTKGEEQQRREVFMHEILEAILTVRNYRFENAELPQNYHFCFDHKDIIDIAKDLSFAIKDIVK